MAKKQIADRILSATAFHQFASEVNANESDLVLGNPGGFAKCDREEKYRQGASQHQDISNSFHNRKFPLRPANY